MPGSQESFVGAAQPKGPPAGQNTPKAKAKSSRCDGEGVLANLEVKASQPAEASQRASLNLVPYDLETKRSFDLIIIDSIFQFPKSQAEWFGWR